MAENTSEGRKLSCTTKSCEEEAVIYCRVCKQLFCKSHKEAHDGFMKLLPTPHEVVNAEEYSPGTEEKKICIRHTSTPIIHACEKCYHPMCSKCLDSSETGATQCTDQEKHETKTIDQIAAKIQDEVRDLLSELRANELVNADNLKERQKIFDEQTEENRSDLEKLASKIGELHKMVDEIGDKTKEALIKRMNEKKALLQKWERQFSDYQQTCTQTHNETSRTLRMSDEIIVKDQKVIKNVLSPLIEFKLEDNIQDMKQFYLVLKDHSIDFSACMKLQETDPAPTPDPVPTSPPVLPRVRPPIPTSIVFKEERDTPSYVYAVQYLKNGQLLDAGLHYGVKGLNYAPQIHSGAIIFSLFEHKSLLYILHDNHPSKTHHIHILNLLTQSVQQSVIQYSGVGYDQQLVVNDDYIIVTDCESESVKVFSTHTHAHQFDIKHECISNRPWGVDFLNNTIVVGDYMRNQISNITISTSPELKWTCEVMKNPSAIRVSEGSQIILVATYNSQQIHLLSYTGERLSTLHVPQCGYIHDITIFENRLAVVYRASKIKIYELKREI